MNTTTKKLSAVKSGDTFRVRGSVSGKMHVATSVARCGRGYVRVETSSPGVEMGQTFHVVNMHGSTEVEVAS